MARVAGRVPPPEVLWRKNLALLIYLARSPHLTRTREHLVGMLWPETPERLARKSLTEAVHRLRTGLGAARLVSHGDAITLDDAALDVDAVTFEATATTDSRRAIRLIMPGDFLEGFSLPDAPGFDQWASSERARYRTKGALLLVEEGERALADVRFADAQGLARRAIALEWFSESAARLVMRAAVLAGDPASALHAYHEYCVRLNTELGEQASRDLAALAERIRSKRWSRASVKYADVDPPLVGRPVLYGKAFANIAQGLRQGPRTIVISGDPGLGKTRLVAECIDRLALEGAHVAAVRSLERDHDTEWSTLRALMRAGMLAAPGLAATPPSALAVLGAIVPELAERTTPRPPRDHAEVADALASLLEAAAHERPLGLAIDDAELADGASLDAFRRATGGLKSVPVVLVITSPRIQEHLPPALLHWHTEIGRSVSGLALELKPLSTGDIRRLTATLATWCESRTDRDRLVRRVAFETGGSPFLAVTLLRGLNDVVSLRADALAWPPPHATFDAPLPLSVPNLARAAIVARVAQLDADVQQVVATASVFGVALDLDLIALLLHQPRHWVEQQLPPLERADLVMFDGERYTFAAALIARALCSECLTTGQRSALRRQAVAVLASRVDLESRVLRVELLTLVEPGPDTVREALAIARIALEEGALRTARRALDAAAAAPGTLGDAERAALASLQARLTALTAARDRA